MNQTAQTTPPVKDGEVVAKSPIPLGVIVVALLTFLNSVPGLSSIRVLGELQGKMLILTILLGLFIRGVLGVVGGIQLLRMKKSGLWLVSLVWVVAILTALFAAFALASRGFPAGVSPWNILFLTFRSLVVGVVFLVYLWLPTVRARFTNG